MADNSMPKEIAEAVVAVMGKVGKLAKDQQNQHGRFKFAGIDAFIEACNPLMHDAGLIIVQSEDDFDMRESRSTKFDRDGNPSEVVTSWLIVRYSFMLVHKGGATWSDKVMRTGFVMASNGPQAPGAAQSYALKNFMRSLFQIATGEAEDTDHHDKGDLPRNARQSPAQPRQQPKAAPQRSQSTNGATLGHEASVAPSDSIPFYDDAKPVRYVNTAGKAQTLDLADAVARLEKAAEATTSLHDEEFAALMNANADWLCNRADAAMKALFGAREMRPEDWLR